MTTETHDSDNQADDGLIDRITDDETPVGDTPQAHDELSPHDIPKSHPAYEDVVRQADGTDGTTSGTA
jgi:hypothetical protein